MPNLLTRATAESESLGPLFEQSKLWPALVTFMLAGRSLEKLGRK